LDASSAIILHKAQIREDLKIQLAHTVTGINNRHKIIVTCLIWQIIALFESSIESQENFTHSLKLSLEGSLDCWLKF
jgi:hypothetical protein